MSPYPCHYSPPSTCSHSVCGDRADRLALTERATAAEASLAEMTSEARSLRERLKDSGQEVERLRAALEASQRINDTLSTAHLESHNRLAAVRAEMAAVVDDQRWHPERRGALAWAVQRIDNWPVQDGDAS